MNKPEVSYVVIDTSHDLNRLAGNSQPGYQVLGDSSTTVTNLESALKRAADYSHLSLDDGDVTICALLPIEVTEEVRSHYHAYIKYAKQTHRYPIIHHAPNSKRSLQAIAS